MAREPLQLPGSAVSVSPSRAVPEIDGAVSEVGADGSIEAGADVAVASPAAFVAVTSTRMRLPVSAALVVYVLPVAPSIGAQSPDGSQRVQR